VKSGYDLTPHRPKHVSEFKSIKFDMVVKMDVPDLGDAVNAKWMENWDIPDPAQDDIEHFRRVRDLIAERVNRLQGPGSPLAA
jgi:protein-tyrosine-phosphatase